MRALIQRVTHATVGIEDGTTGTFDGIEAIGAYPARSIGRGFVILLGVGEADGKPEAEKLWRKISKLRIFDDQAGKTNLSLADVDGDVMVVSQFTLYANCKKGNRPSFTQAGDPDQAKLLYRYFTMLAARDVGHIAVGEFGAHMKIDLENDGPFTIWLDTDTL